MTYGTSVSSKSAIHCVKWATCSFGLVVCVTGAVILGFGAACDSRRFCVCGVNATNNKRWRRWCGAQEWHQIIIVGGLRESRVSGKQDVAKDQAEHQPTQNNVTRRYTTTRTSGIGQGTVDSAHGKGRRGETHKKRQESRSEETVRGAFLLGRNKRVQMQCSSTVGA